MKGSSLLSFLVLFSILFWMIDEYFVSSFLEEKSLLFEKKFYNASSKNILNGLTSNFQNCFSIQETQLCSIKGKFLVSLKDFSTEHCTQGTSPRTPLILTSKYTCQQTNFSHSKIIFGNIDQEGVFFEKLITVAITGFLTTKNFISSQQGGLLVAHGDITVDTLNSNNLTLISTSGSIVIKRAIQADNFSAFAKRVTLPPNITNQRNAPATHLPTFLLSASPKDS